jgi:glycosyltransferase involved in cell wall biosynthesis
MRLLFLNRTKGVFWSIEELFRVIGEFLPTFVECRSINLPRPGAKLRSLIVNLRQVWKIRNVDCVHVTGDIHYATLAVHGCPVVLTIHDLRFFEESHGFRRCLLWLLWIYLPVQRANHLTVISEFTRDQLARVCRASIGKVTVVPNCVDPEFVPIKRDWPVDRPRVLHVGTTSNKNLERFAEACKGLPIELWILGSLSDTQRGLLSAARINFTEFFGLSRAAVVKLYQDCDMVSFVSTFEGFGLPVLESQAVGRPLLTSDISPIREVSGGAAMLVNPFDVAEIRTGLNRLLNDASLREELIAKGLHNVKKYTPETVANQYLQVYQRVTSAVQ